MKLEALDHPKTLDFAARLHVSLPTAIGHLELLWAFVAKKAPQGDVGKWADGAVARSAYWTDEPSTFIAALVDSGFLDDSKEHRLLVHDWSEHMPNWVRAKLKKAGKTVLSAHLSTDESGKKGQLSADLSTDLSGDSVREGKGREGKASENKGAGAPGFSPPDWVKPEVWQDFEAMRIRVRKPMTDRARELVVIELEKLRKLGHEPNAVLDQSVRNSWQDVYQLKGDKVHQLRQAAGGDGPTFRPGEHV